MQAPSERAITEPIQIVVNGQARSLPPGSDLAALLALLDIPPRHIAIEIDGELHEGELDRTLRPGERVEIVRFVGGG
jgi:thiamine biosynthesis protein ThiS